MCLHISNEGDGMSIRSLLSGVFYDWTTGGAAFVKTATAAAAAQILMAAAHLWIIQTAVKGTEPIYRGNHCTVAGQSLNLSATSPFGTLMGSAACLLSPRGVKWKRVNK